MSVSVAGASAVAVLPLAVCLRHSPFGSETVPGPNPRSELRAHPHFSQHVPHPHVVAVRNPSRRRVVGMEQQANVRTGQLAERRAHRAIGRRARSARAGTPRFRDPVGTRTARAALRDRAARETGAPCGPAFAGTRRRTGSGAPSQSGVARPVAFSELADVFGQAIEHADEGLELGRAARFRRRAPGGGRDPRRRPRSIAPRRRDRSPAASAAARRRHTRA